MFETRWEEPVIQDKILFTMEIFTEPEKKWRKIGEWVHSLTEQAWSELTENGTSIGASNLVEQQIQKEHRHPPDLHKYSGTNNLNPKGFINAESSYLDFPPE